ncbi:GrpB family protein [Gemelliphila palaticanis]|nr:GrpB family protein [Gemella palaticanis]
MKRDIKQIKINKNYYNKYTNEVTQIKNIYKFPNCEFLHIGSTSIENSLGEEIIDILVIVDNLHEITNFDEKRLNNIKYHRVAHNNKGLISYCKIVDFNSMNYDVKLFIVQKDSKVYNEFIKFNNYLLENNLIFEYYQNFKKDNLELKNNPKEYFKQQKIFINKILKEEK